MDPTVDIDDPATWPSGVVGTVEDAIGQATGDNWREDPFDCFASSDFEAAEAILRSHLADHRLIGYHATRLLPHEVNDVRDGKGLQALTDELRQRKVDEARTHFPEAFDSDESDGGVLLASGPNAWQGSSEYRLGYIFFVAPFTFFREDARGLMNLMDTWGGETLGWLNRDSARPISYALTALSTPAIVEFCVGVPTLNARPLLPAFVGRWAGVSGKYWGGWETTESVPAEHVLNILTPGSTRWPPTLDEYSGGRETHRRPLSQP